MPSTEIIRRCIGLEILSAAEGREAELCEIRLRTGRHAVLRFSDGSSTESINITREKLANIVSALQMGSYYAVENQMRQGYFTLQGGIRVGVCGKMNVDSRGEYALSSIASVCIRIPSQVKGCASVLWDEIGFSNILIVSPPGMGKTTLLRDYLRIASDAGYNIAIADERREIAACFEGIPQMDVGKCTDVLDDCPKERSIPLLLRSFAPDMIAADEIATEAEAAVLREACKCGVRIAATAHASGIEDANNRRVIGDLIREKSFSDIVVLGCRPGHITGIYKY